MAHLSKQKLLSGKVTPVRVVEQQLTPPDFDFLWVRDYLDSLTTAATPQTINNTYFVIDSIG